MFEDCEKDSTFGYRRPVGKDFPSAPRSRARVFAVRGQRDTILRRMSRVLDGPTSSTGRDPADVIRGLEGGRGPDSPRGVRADSWRGLRHRPPVGRTGLRVRTEKTECAELPDAPTPNPPAGRGRRAAELHEDRAPRCSELRARPRASRRVLVHTGQHYDADDVRRSSSEELGIPRAGRQPRGRLRHATREQTAEVLMAFEEVLLAANARRRGRRRRRQLDARRDAGRREARHPGGARRGRAALLRPHACPRRSTASSPTPSRDLLLTPSSRRRREPAARGRRPGAHPLRRQRHDRHPAREPRRGRARSTSSRRLGPAPRRLRRRDAAPAEQRRRPRDASRPLFGVLDEHPRASCPVVFPVHPRTRAADRSARSAGRAPSAAAHASRSATSSSSRLHGRRAARPDRLGRHPGRDHGARRAVPDAARQHRAPGHGRPRARTARRADPARSGPRRRTILAGAGQARPGARALGRPRRAGASWTCWSATLATTAAEARAMSGAEAVHPPPLRRLDGDRRALRLRADPGDPGDLLHPGDRARGASAHPLVRGDLLDKRGLRERRLAWREAEPENPSLERARHQF